MFVATMEVELEALSKYLEVSCGKIVLDPKEKIPVLKTKTDGTIRGLVSVAKHIVRSSSKNSSMKGNTLEERFAIDQWLEYRVTHVDKVNQEKDIHSVLMEMNSYLTDKVFFVGHQMSLADIVLYSGIHRIFTDLSFLEKQKYMHLSRWFQNMQSRVSLALAKSLISFQKNLIYYGSLH